jgi:hypothetical protein
MSDEIQERFDLLLNRLETSYDGIGQSSGRPYIYFIYPLTKERQLQRMIDEQLKTHRKLVFYCVDMLAITITSIDGQEERRKQFLDDPLRSRNQAEAILHLWAGQLGEEITGALETLIAEKRPIVVLHNLAALHPLSDPTSLMEFLAEQEPRNPTTGTIVPIVLFVPGSRLRESSRTYLFLDQIQLDFYRGEEI